MAATLSRTEEALATGGEVDLSELGFWKAVGAVKRNPAWVDEFADRIGTIDTEAFERAVSPTFSPALGTAVLTAGSLVSLGVAAAAFWASEPWDGVLVLLGTGGLLGATHGLGHVVVGRSVGIRFTHWFLNGPTRLQPGAKTDYSTYLRTPGRARAWMHASGAIVTKIIPFLMIPVAESADTPSWTTWALLIVGVGQILTDVLYSVRFSDWKRFRREMQIAREIEAA